MTFDPVAELAAVADADLLACTGFVLVGAVVRGFSGFGSIMVMIPGFSLILGAGEAIALGYLLETWTVLQLLPIAVREARWGSVAPMAAAFCLFIPAGIGILVTVDPEIMRRAIAGVVLAFSAVMLAGWRYHGRRTAAHGAAVGATSGVLCGATGIAGPPVILYLMAGPDPAGRNRANVMAFYAVAQAAALIGFASAGVLTLDTLWRALWLLPINVVGLWLGSRLFGLASERTFRTAALSLLILNSLVVLLA